MQEQYFTKCNCEYCKTNTIKLTANGKISKLFQNVLNAGKKAFKRLYENKNYKPEDLFETKEYRELIDETSKVFNSAISYEVSDTLRSYLEQDVFVFSGLKVHSELTEARSYLKNKKGNITPYHKFEQKVLKLNSAYNKNYLKVEYEFAVGSAQMAEKWESFSDDETRYLIQYRTDGGPNVRASHQALNGTTLPKSDPFFSMYTPPNGWNCHCFLVEVLARKYKRSDSKEAIQKGKVATTQINKSGKNKLEMFRFNPGLQKKVFPPKNSYSKVVGAEKVLKEAERKANKLLSKKVLEYGKQNIIGKYKFKHEKFTGTFVKNSFTENLRFGELFNAKIEILQNIKSYLENANDYEFKSNVQTERKPEVLGYHTLKAKYKGKDEKLIGREIEFQFEDRGKQGVKFHFIKFIKKD